MEIRHLNTGIHTKVIICEGGGAIMMINISTEVQILIVAFHLYNGFEFLAFLERG